MLLYHSEIFEKHDTGTHPECIARIVNVNRMLEKQGWIERCTKPNWMAATLEQCKRNHTEKYLDQLHRWCEESAGRVESDTVVSSGSWDAATLAAGAACDAVRRVCRGEDTQAFCAVRPPGHHALRDAPMGFCLLNSVSIAAQHARSLGCEKVLIVDWDVHHGNGTEAIFRRDPSVLYFSTHQSPLYPGTGSATDRGEGPGEGTTINCPLPPGSDGDAVLAALRERLVPAAEWFQPQLVLVSAGFDGRRGDPLADFQLSDADFGRLTLEVRALADRHCQGRLVSSLEGGYALAGLASACVAHVEALLS